MVTLHRQYMTLACALIIRNSHIVTTGCDEEAKSRAPVNIRHQQSKYAYWTVSKIKIEMISSCRKSENEPT